MGYGVLEQEFKVEEKVREKLQILVIYAGFNIATGGRSQQLALIYVLAQYPYTEVFLGTGPLYRDALYRIKPEYIGVSFEQIIKDAEGLNTPQEIIAKFLDVVNKPLITRGRVEGDTTKIN
ncbi:MAG: hypothetical protein QXQ02_10105, partial [Halobacteria archaeon]